MQEQVLVAETMYEVSNSKGDLGKFADPRLAAKVFCDADPATRPSVIRTDPNQRGGRSARVIARTVVMRSGEITEYGHDVTILNVDDEFREAIKMAAKTDTKSKAPSIWDLDEGQRAALLEFREQNGRNWKSKLLSGWTRAAFPGHLQAIRNQFGPEWLNSVKDFDAGVIAVKSAEQAAQTGKILLCPAFRGGCVPPKEDGVYLLESGKFSRYFGGLWRREHVDYRSAANEIGMAAFSSPQFRIYDEYRWAHPETRLQIRIETEDHCAGHYSVAWRYSDRTNGAAPTDTLLEWSPREPDAETKSVYVSFYAGGDAPVSEYVIDGDTWRAIEDRDLAPEIWERVFKGEDLAMTIEDTRELVTANHP